MGRASRSSQRKRYIFSVKNPGETNHSRMRVILPGAIAGLFHKLALGRALGRLAGINRSGGNFQQCLTRCVAFILDQAYVLVVNQRNEGDGPGMDDQLTLGSRFHRRGGTARAPGRSSTRDRSLGAWMRLPSRLHSFVEVGDRLETRVRDID